MPVLFAPARWVASSQIAHLLEGDVDFSLIAQRFAPGQTRAVLDFVADCAWVLVLRAVFRWVPSGSVDDFRGSALCFVVPLAAFAVVLLQRASQILVHGAKARIGDI